MQNIVFFAGEVVQITGCERETECSHCSRPLKVGVKLAGFPGAFGADCLARAACKNVHGPYVQRLSGAAIRERSIIAYKGDAYARRNYGWDLTGPAFRLTLKTPLQSI